MTSKSRFFDDLGVVQRTLRDTSLSVDEVLDRIEPLLRDPAVEREFFNHLSSPAWITPLDRRGYFDNPPEPQKAMGGELRHPLWPQSQYLVRQAEAAPALVADILKRIETTNWSVARDVVVAAKSLPAEEAIKLSDKIKAFVNIGLLWNSLDDVSDVAISLNEGGHSEAGVELVVSCFRLSWSQEQSLKGQDDYWYIKCLSVKIIPAFICVQSSAIVWHLLDELERACRAKAYFGTREPQDSSSI